MVRDLIVEWPNLVKYCNRKYFVKILGVPIWSSFLRRPNDRRCFGIMKYLFIMSRKKKFRFSVIVHSRHYGSTQRRVVNSVES